MFNDDDFLNSFDPDLLLAVERFEEMVNNKGHYFFESDELEEIFEYYYHQGHIEQASRVVEFGLVQNPYSALFYVKRAQISISHGKFEEALEFLNQAEIFEPTNYELYLLRGSIYDLLGNPKEAVKHLKTAEGFAEDQVEVVYNALAGVFINWKKYNSAIYYLQLVLNLIPDHAEALYDICFCYHQLEDMDSGVSFFKDWIEKDPYSDVAWYNLATLYNKASLFEKAIDAFDYAILINDKNSLAWFNKANTYINMEDFVQALDCMYKAHDVEPDNPVLRCGVGVCHEKMGRITEARSWYAKALEMDPILSDAWYGLGICDELEDDYENSIIHIRRALEYMPDSEEYWCSLAEVYGKMGDIVQALQSYKHALQIDEGYYEARIDMADLLMKEGKQTDAALLLAEGVQLHGTEADFFYRLAALYYTHNLVQECLLQLQHALTLDFDSHQVFLELIPDGVEDIRLINLINSSKK
ncbi:MAG: tetratricopeptide repeat protein [Bacteroidia bacterium]